jgi:hypothetical protein
MHLSLLKPRHALCSIGKRCYFPVDLIMIFFEFWAILSLSWSLIPLTCPTYAVYLS